MYISGRGDEALGAIPEADADFETTNRHTAIRSELGVAAHMERLSHQRYSL